METATGKRCRRKHAAAPGAPPAAAAAVASAAAVAAAEVPNIDSAVVVKRDARRDYAALALRRPALDSSRVCPAGCVAYLHNIRILFPVAPLTGQYSRGGLN